MPSHDQMKTEAIIGMISASISIVSSITIIILISKSTEKFTTILNRLLLGLCISDLLSSTGQAFASLPMPSDTENSWMAFGNTTTCDIQGFVIYFAAVLTPSYNAGICIVSWLKIKYNNQVDVHKVEPFLHIIPISLSFALSLYSVLKGYMNPSFGSCSFNDKPEGCSMSADGSSCERGDGIFEDGVIIFLFVLTFVILPSLIISTMINLYITVKRQEDRMVRYGIGSLTSLSDNERRSNSRYTTKVMYRAISYSAAWFIPFIFPFIGTFQILILNQELSPALRILTMIFFPLQGFCNLIVFIYPKMLVIRLLHPEYSIFQLFVAVLSKNGEDGITDHDERVQLRRLAVQNKASPVCVESQLVALNTQEGPKTYGAVVDEEK